MGRTEQGKKCNCEGLHATGGWSMNIVRPDCAVLGLNGLSVFPCLLPSPDESCQGEHDPDKVVLELRQALESWELRLPGDLIPQSWSAHPSRRNV